MTYDDYQTSVRDIVEWAIYEQDDPAAIEAAIEAAVHEHRLLGYHERRVQIVSNGFGPENSDWVASPEYFYETRDAAQQIMLADCRAYWNSLA